MWKWIMQRHLPAAFWLSGPLTQMEEFLQLAEKNKIKQKNWVYFGSTPNCIVTTN